MSKRKYIDELSQSQIYRRLGNIRNALQQVARNENEDLHHSSSGNSSEDDVAPVAFLEVNEDENQENDAVPAEPDIQHDDQMPVNENENDEIRSNISNDEMNVQVEHSNHGSDPENDDPDSSDGNNSDSEEEEFNVKKELAEWVVKSGTSRSATASLLKILRNVPGLEGLPQNRGSLVQTEKEAVQLKLVPPGEYFHFGLENGLRVALRQTYVNLQALQGTAIKILVNIDGVSLAKSSYSQLIPILGLASNLSGSKVFRIGIYHGNKKPDNIFEFFDDFVSESIQLVTNGIVFDGANHSVRISGFIMDLPAKSFAINTKGHADCELRTDDSFRAQNDPDHHNGNTPLVNIPHFDMVKGIPIEPFHQEIIGAAKNKLKRLHKESPTRLRREVRNALSDEMGRMAPHIPWEFARKPRNLDYLDKFKGTELRLFLKYLCPVVLKKILNGDPVNEDHYTHFVSLHITSRMLSGNPSPVEIDYCEQLLRNFVIDYRTLHGEVSITQNIHSLIHLANDVRIFGSLENFSAFPFENENGLIRRELKFGNTPLKQLVKRHQESTKNIRVKRSKAPSITVTFSHPRAHGPVAANCVGPYFKMAHYHCYKIGVSHPNNCIMTKDHKVHLVENIAFSNVLQKNVLIAREYLRKQDLYEEPRRSSSIYIYVVSELGPLQALDPDAVESKCVRLPVEENFAVLPLLHC
ncbi:hypothetical protein B566_EDAN012987 [Ephemera danica]|nr:hypothetical protein B566_EDAN012987 [Ephemera danica]